MTYKFIKSIEAEQRPADVLARFWDSNFAIMRPNSTKESLSNLAKKINTIISDTNLLNSLPSDSVKVETKIFTLQKSNTGNNFIDMVSVE